jgi:hypothetical protein
MEIPMTDLAALADRFGSLKAQIEALSRELDEVKTAIKATGREEIVGADYVAKVVLQERSSLDMKLAKALLTEDEIAACTRVQLIEMVTSKAIEHVNA